ncbi:MAG: hypothetical protein RQ966_14825 [Acetobacteraceae bacterium]|nr:hypothetical protein [Acetobacteraceae bacterium]
MLIASSPVEIDAEADEAGLSPAAREAAKHLFHELTDRLGQAVIDLSVRHETWPNHRLYFSTEPGGLAQLEAGLKARPDIVEVANADTAAPIAGLYCRAEADGCAAILVGHENHEGYLSPHPEAKPQPPVSPQ